jgi:hypothetical protein
MDWSLSFSIRAKDADVCVVSVDEGLYLGFL